jgi:competence protein ComEA
MPAFLRHAPAEPRPSGFVKEYRGRLKPACHADVLAGIRAQPDYAGTNAGVASLEACSTVARTHPRRPYLCALLLLSIPGFAQLPPGPGKAETEKLCSQCHELARSIAPRQDRTGWEATLDKMVSLGAKGTDKEFEAVLDYLAKNYPAAPAEDRLNVNKARAIELESTIGLRRSEAAAIIAYREKNGPFKSIDDLKKVPGVDSAKIESKKDRLAF